MKRGGIETIVIVIFLIAVLVSMSIVADSESNINITLNNSLIRLFKAPNSSCLDENATVNITNRKTNLSSFENNTLSNSTSLVNTSLSPNITINIPPVTQGMNSSVSNISNQTNPINDFMTNQSEQNISETLSIINLSITKQLKQDYSQNEEISLSLSNLLINFSDIEICIIKKKDQYKLLTIEENISFLPPVMGECQLEFFFLSLNNRLTYTLQVNPVIMTASDIPISNETIQDSSNHSSSGESVTSCPLSENAGTYTMNLTYASQVNTEGSVSTPTENTARTARSVDFSYGHHWSGKDLVIDLFSETRHEFRYISSTDYDISRDFFEKDHPLSIVVYSYNCSPISVSIDNSLYTILCGNMEEIVIKKTPESRKTPSDINPQDTVLSETNATLTFEMDKKYSAASNIPDSIDKHINQYIECLVKTSENTLAPEPLGNSRAGYIIACRPSPAGWGKKESDPKRYAIITIPASEFNQSWLEPEYVPFDIKTNMSPDIKYERKYRLPLETFLDKSELEELYSIEYNKEVNWSIRKNITNVAAKLEAVDWNFLPQPEKLHGSAGTSTICPVGCDYTSLAAWENGEDGHNTNAPTIANITGAFQDTSAIMIEGWNSNSTAYIEIKVDEDVRHNGTWSDKAYRLEANGGWFGVIDVREKDVYIDGLQLSCTNMGDSGNNHGIYFGAGSGNFNLSNSILTRTGNRTTGHALYLGQIDAGKFTANVWNNIIYNFPQYGIANSWGHAGHTYNIHSNTLYNISTDGIRLVNAVETLNISVKNNIVMNTSDDYSIVAFTYMTVENNLGQDLDSFAGHVVTDQDCEDMFTTCTGGHDLHLIPGADAIDAGQDLTNDYNLSVVNDIEGDARTDPYDIGADEYVGPPDVTPPTWYDNQTNKTHIYQGDIINFTTTFEDESALDQFIFSTNLSGIWANSSPVKFSYNPQNATNVSYIYQTPGFNLAWQFHANDSAGNWNQTAIYNFTVLGVRFNDSSAISLSGNSNKSINITRIIISYGENINISVSCYEGNCTHILANMTSTNATDSSSELVFNCTYPEESELSANFSLKSLNDTIKENISVSCSVTNSFRIVSVPDGQSYFLAEDTSVNLSETGQTGIHEVYAGINGNVNFSAGIYINFSHDINVSNITMGFNRTQKKSFIHNYSSVSGIINTSLLVPRVNNSHGVYVCRNATSIPEIDKSCENYLEIDTNHSASGMTVTEIEIGGKGYYHISNISGTGAQENTKIKLEIWDDTDSEEGLQTIYTFEPITFYANLTIRGEDSPVEGAEVYCDIRFNLTDGWTEYYRMSYDAVEEYYTYETSFENISGSLWSLVFCNATSENYELINVSDNFTITHSNWDIIYGNTSGNLSVGNHTLYKWSLIEHTGNVFAADADSIISWDALKALGRNTSDNISQQDFEDADISLDMSGDNITYLWLNTSGEPLGISNISTFAYPITDIPIINTTNNSNFVTGILWDTSDDTQNGGTEGEYDSTDQEDLVFVATVLNLTLGKYDIYDYELRVPFKLKDYKSGISEIALYVELK